MPPAPTTEVRREVNDEWAIRGRRSSLSSDAMARGGSNVCGFSLPTVCFVLLTGLAVSVTRGGRWRVGLGESDVVEVEPSPARPSPPSPARPHQGSTPPAPTDPTERGLNVGSHRARCLSGDLSRGVWVACDRAAHAVAGCDPAGGGGGDRAWEFSPPARERCEASKIDRDELAAMLAGETVAGVGDSAARMVSAAILRLVAKTPTPGAWTRRRNTGTGRIRWRPTAPWRSSRGRPSRKT